jgi:hypothetical protein
MESYVFDIILITLAIVILLHLVFNNSLSINPQCRAETMKDSRLSDRNNGYIGPAYDDGVYRDSMTHGIDRTNESKKWYHVTNKLVTNDTSDISDLSLKAVDDLQKIASDQEKSRSKEKEKKKIDRLVFDDNYEGKLSSDPFDAETVKLPATFGPKHKYSDEKYVDVNGNVCTTSETDVDVKRYIRDYVLDGKAQCGCVVDKSKSDFTRDEINQYREKQLEFFDKINGTSQPAEDPVDRMNQITLSGGVKANGQTIADYYDNIVRVSNLNGPGFILGTSVPDYKCVNPPNYDGQSGVPQGYYTGDANANGKYMMRDNWMYSNENPNNGGKFYNGIAGYDPMIDNDRMID